MSRKTKLPTIGNKLDAKFSISMAELIGIWKGERGDKLDRVLTLRDLTESGLVNSTSAGNISSEAPEDGMFPGTPDPTIPTAPTGFAVSAAVLKAILSWDTNSASNHAHTEIWRSDTDDLGAAIQQAQTSAAVYADSIDSGEIVYYWVRHVNTAGIPGPYNAVAGTSTEASRVLVGATPIQWENLRNATADDITGGIESTAAAGWSAGGTAENSVAEGDLFMQWSNSDTSGIWMMGIDAGNPNGDYREIDFALHAHTTAYYHIWQDGAWKQTLSIIPTAGDTCAMSVEGTDVIVRINGNVVYTWSGATVDYPVHPVSALHTGGVDAASWDRGNPGVHGLLLQGNISNGAVTGLQLANLAVDTAAIADAAIVTAKIGDAEINTAKIADYIQSDNYSDSGTYQGWKISARGGEPGVIRANQFEIRDSTGKILLTTGATVSSAFIHAASKLTNSNISTYVAAAAIKTAYIQDLAVSTLKIGNQAVTIPTSGSNNVGLVSSGAPINIVATIMLQWDGGANGNDTNVWLKEDGIQIATFNGGGFQHYSTGSSISGVFNVTRQPGSGWHYYTVGHNNTSDFATRMTGILLIETKK